MAGILIAGPARCGKSTLAKVFSKKSNQAILTVDALLPAYKKRKIKINDKNYLDFVSEYLARPRYINAENTEFSKPSDDIDLNIDEIKSEIKYTTGLNAVRLILKILNLWQVKYKKDFWIAPDLHSELISHEILAFDDELKILVLLRNPLESVTASLYWRTYPERCKNHKKILIYRLILWCLSAHVGSRLSNEYDDRVYLICLNNLSDSESNDVQKILDITNMDIQDLQSIKPRELYFSYDKNNRWLCPNEEMKELLNDKEIRLIKTVSQPWHDYLPSEVMLIPSEKAKVICAKMYLSMVFMIEKISPYHAKTFIDWCFFPIKNIRNSISIIISSFYKETSHSQSLTK